MLKERKETPAIIFYLNKQGCHGLAVRMSNILEELEKTKQNIKKSTTTIGNITSKKRKFTIPT